MASKAAEKKAIPAASAQPVRVYSQINTLLYTLRAIAQREDQLCTLMHHLRTSGKLTPTLNAELHAILEEIPTQEYLHDVDALRASLTTLDEGGKLPTQRAKSGSKRKAA